MRANFPTSKISQGTVAALTAICANGYVGIASAQNDSGVISTGPTLEEVVITARKREENWTDVPIAVSSFQGPALEQAQIENSTDLVGYTPGLFLANGDQGFITDSQFLVIRGIGATPIIEPAVGTFVDGVYQTALSFDMPFLDVERIEVLRGPQGTLFGRNTQGGAVNIVTRKPANDELGGRVKLAYDDYDRLDLQGRVEGPISDDLSFSLVGRYREQDGYIDNKTLSKPHDEFEEKAGRLRLFYENEALTVDFTLFATDKDYGSLSFGIPIPQLDDLEAFDGDFEDSFRETLGSSLRFDYDFSDYTFTSITAYTEIDSKVFHDTDQRAVRAGVQRLIYNNESFTQEFRLAFSGSEKFDWSIGAYYFTEDRFLLHEIEAGPERMPEEMFLGVRAASGGALIADLAGFYYDTDNIIEREGWAAFGQGDWYITDKLTATFGLRYSSEVADFETYSRSWGLDTASWWEPAVLGGFGSLNDPSTGEPWLIPFPDFAYVNDTDISEKTWMGSLMYGISDNSSIYGTVSKGFKAGGFQDFVTLAPEAEPFDNETSINYEIGYKASLWDRRLNLNLAAYYIEIEEQQIKVRRIVGSTFFNETLNIGESHTSGAEVEATALLAEGLTLRGSWGWVKDAQFDSIDTVSDAANIQELEGERFALVPEHTASLALNYVAPIFSDLELNVLVDLVYVDDYVSTFVADPTAVLTGAEIEAHSVWNFSTAIGNENWTGTFFVMNVADEDAIVNRQMSTFNFLDEGARIIEPRRIGASFEYRF